MLGNRLKKELREGNWEKYTKEYANYYELIKRNKSKIKDAMTDIELLARKLPDGEQEKLFDNQIIEKMISGIFLNENFLFKKEYYDTDIDYLDKRRIQIAFNIIRQSISFILNQAQILYKDSPSIYELIESQLKQSLKICEDIANKIEMMALREKEKDRKLKYLFNWNKIPGPDESKLQFVYDLESLEDMHYLYSIKKISKSKDKSKISFQLVIDDETLIEDFGHDIIDISISLPDKIYEKNVDKEASIRISHSNGKIVDIPLVIHEDMGTKYVFLKRSDKPKKIKK